MKNETILKIRNPFPFKLSWKVSFFVLALPSILMILLLFVISINFDFSSQKAQAVFLKLLFSTFVFIAFNVMLLYALALKIGTSLTINGRGITRKYHGGLPLAGQGFSYNWESIESISINKMFSYIEIKIKNIRKKIKIPFYAYEIDKSSVKFKVIKPPITNYGKAKFDLNETAILKVLNYWKPKLLFPDDIYKPKVLFDQTDLGKKILGFAVAGVVSVLLFLISMPLSQKIMLHNGFYWIPWLVLFGVMLIFGFIFLQQELLDKSKRIGVIVVSLFFAATFSLAVAGLLEVYTKFSNNYEIVEFSLVDTTEKHMVWASKNTHWSKFWIRFDFDYERKIEIGDSINLKVNKGFFGIYSASIDSYEIAAEKFKDIYGLEEIE